MIIQSKIELTIPSEFVGLKEGIEISKLLIEELKKSDVGVGLSAPQIGILKKVAVIQTFSGYRTLINPKLPSLENPFINPNEGCLSFPGIRINTIRYHNILIEDDFNISMALSNFAAVIAQHELDHLNGILLFDRKVPEVYDNCFCGSEKKFKFCCKNIIR